MKLSRFKIFLLALFFSLIPLQAYANTLAFDNIIFFGDSLTDNGNLYSYDLGLLPKSPPYYRGRFSNGLVWSEKVAARFTAKDITSENYAVGGETVNLHDPFEGFLPYIFSESMDDYYLRNLMTDKSHTLFIIWLGANDYLNDTKADPANVSAVITTLQNNMENLMSKGAKNFLVVNLPDLGLTPYAKAQDKQTVLSGISVMHNIALQAGILMLQSKHTDVKIHLFDINTLYADLLSHPDVYNKKYGTRITNVTEPCWPGGHLLKQGLDENSIASQLEKDYRASLAANGKKPVKLDFKGFASDVAKNPDLSVAYATQQAYASGMVPCDDPDSHAFWDDVHPTTVVHSILTEVMVDTINQYYQAK